MKLEQVLIGTLQKRRDGEFVLATDEERTVLLEFRSTRSRRAAENLEDKRCEARGTYARSTFVVDAIERHY